MQELLEQEIAREIDDDIDPSAHGWQEETLEIRFERAFQSLSRDGLCPGRAKKKILESKPRV